MTESQKITLQPALDVLAGDIDSLEKLEYTIVVLGNRMASRRYSEAGVLDAVRSAVYQLNRDLLLGSPNEYSDK